MNLSYTLSLPVDLRYVSLVRHLCAGALSELGVVPECIDDIALALTEATANVVKHSGQDAEFEVRIAVEGAGSDAVCRIEVVDTGTSSSAHEAARRLGEGELPLSVADAETADDLLTHGRGLALMRILVDSLAFSPDAAGTTVVLVKQLELSRDSALALPGI